MHSCNYFPNIPAGQGDFKSMFSVAIPIPLSSKQQMLVMKENVPTHRTIGIMAIDKWGKLPNFTPKDLLECQSDLRGRQLEVLQQVVEQL